MKYNKLAIFILYCILSFSAVTVLATSISDLQNEQKGIEDDIKNAQDELDSIEGELSEAQKELTNLDIQLNTAEKEYNNIVDQLNVAERELLQAEAELVEAIEIKNSQYEILKNRLAYMYEYGNISYVEIIFGSDSIYDMFNRVEYVTRIAEYDRNLLNLYEEQEKIVNNKVKEIEIRKAEIQVLVEEAEVKKINLENAYAEKSLLVSRMENNKEEQQKMIAELQRANKEIENKIKEEQRKAEELLKQQQEAGNDMIYTGGKLGWPVPGYSRISSGYVDRLNPVTGVAEFHKGIDIPAPTGTNIVAAESGVVIDSRYSSSYGYLVVISHGSGLSTLYAHNSELLVSKGDIVTRGSTIARAGSTGNSTGPHCHLEVRVNGVAVNPMPYIQ